MATGLFGVSSLTVDGEPLSVEGDLTIVDSAPMVEAEADVHGNVYLKEKGKPGKISGNLFVNDPGAIATLRAKRNATVVARCRNGVTFILRQASAVGDWSFNMGDGKVAAEFIGRGEWDAS